ncbi:Holliday junction resolvase RuvX [Boudabousia marimammalium]|uniref:Putative pre-16S rRNA nuclease n=1 Tax=Boudabousia marimammalium TaxID=156892 RepID=A0A1Q5PQW2_9ACTO|nr:Holliday junction resolvase RuvX [Boudabousia marimammalium]OKL50011.1 hypothetical protein BM477_03725 [Boudabousia marimammalium]
MPSGSRMAFDVGKARIGGARSVSGTSVTLPTRTYRVRSDWSHWADIVSDIEEYAPEIIYVGKPLHLNGSAGRSVAMAEKFARQLRKRCPEVEIRMVDERLTTTSAHQQLAEAGVSGTSRTAMIDQAAATVILDFALSIEDAQGQSAGTLFS